MGDLEFSYAMGMKNSNRHCHSRRSALLLFVSTLQIKLPSFWPEDPTSWFCLVEGQFTLRNVVDPVTCYYHVLAALLVDLVHLVQHVLYEETGPESYAQLRASLMASHSVSNYQKMERMMRLPPFGDCKPSMKLAEMLEFCPAGELSTAVFAFLFLQRLPQEIRVLLSEDDPANMRAIAEKDDRLIAMHGPQSHDSCAVVAAAEQLHAGHLSYIAEFAPTIRHITSESNILADTLP
jgi:hypothetical protein